MSKMDGLLGLGLLVCLMLGLKTVADSAQLPIPSIKAVKTTKPPVLDGKIGDSVWQTAAKVTGFVDYQKGTPVTQQTEAYLLYDETNIYLAFKCYESQMENLKTSVIEQNGSVWLDDSIEIFVSPFYSASKENYYQFVANANGITYAAFLGGSEKRPEWQVKTAKYDKYWTMECAIPFSSFLIKGPVKPYWRINFCRNEKPSSELSAWACTYGGFHTYARFGKLTDLELKAKFANYKGVPTKIEPKSSTTGTVVVEQVYKPLEKPVLIIPKPMDMKLLPIEFKLTPETLIVVGDNATSEDLRGATELVDEIKGKTDFNLKIVKVKELGNQRTNIIVVGERKLNSVAEELAKKLGLKVDQTQPGEEGYALQVTPEIVAVIGCDQCGSYYGIQSLKQLIFSNVVKGALIYDKPAMKYRGLHLIPDKDSLWFHGKLIKRMFSRFKMNQIVWEVEQSVKWKSTPTLNNPMSMEIDDVKKLVKIGNEHFMDSIPLIQSYGHLEFVFRDKKNLEFVEDPQKPYAYCPLNPKSYEFMFSLFDEAIEVFNNPEYINIGHDEQDMIGNITYHPECKKIGAVDLYYQDTMKIYNHLKEKGVKTMMWAEVWLKPGYREKVVSLPRDVVMADWHYGPDKEYPSVDFYQKLGFPVIGCTWYTPKNIQGFAQYIEHKGELGLMQTTWAGYHGTNIELLSAFEQVSAYILAGEFAWAGKRNSLETLGYDPEQVLFDLWMDEPWYNKPHRGFMVDISTVCNISLIDKETDSGWLGLGEGKDLAKLSVGQQRLEDGVIYQIIDSNKNKSGACMLYTTEIGEDFPKSVTIPINKKASKLSFLHTTARSDKKWAKSGKYVINYADGKKEEVELLYGINIHNCLDDQQSIRMRLAWKSKTPDNESIVLRSYLWDNPRPEAEISSIDFVANTTGPGAILIAITGME